MNRDCQIVQDLLPLYVEKMTSMGSEEFIESHLGTCSQCQQELSQLQTRTCIPMETDTQKLRSLRKGLKRRTVFPVLFAAFFVLTICTAVLIWGMIPVWVSAEEGVVSVCQMEDGQIRIEAAEHVYGITSYNNRICFEKLRLDWFVNQTVKEMRSSKERYFYVHLDEGESLWYSGKQTGTNDTLLWGDGSQTDGWDQVRHAEKELIYVFWITGGCGLSLLVLGILFRKKKAGWLCFCGSALLLCCAGACLFVTNGHLISKEVIGASVRFNRLPQQRIAIGAMTAVSFGAVLFAVLSIKAFKNSQR